MWPIERMGPSIGTCAELQAIFNPYERKFSGDNQSPGGFSSFGNFNNDPFPEVVINGGSFVTLVDHLGNQIWHVNRGIGGPATISDFDGDGIPEVAAIGNDFITVVDQDGTQLWRKTIAERSSGFTGLSVFDFENDGSTEVVYADEEYLRVYRGRDGKVLFQVANPSGTFIESPVIADVDNDGRAEIIVGRNQLGGFGGRTGTFSSGIYVYGDALDQWVGTRRIWNQHGYYITNVNEDGTIPQNEIPNWQVFNNFRQNQLFPDEGTAGPHGAPDVTASLIQPDIGLCPASATVTARIGNGGGDVVPAGIPINFFDGDPQAGAPLIKQVLTSHDLIPGAYEDVAALYDNPPPGRHLLTVVADDTEGAAVVESENLLRLDGVTLLSSNNFKGPSSRDRWHGKHACRLS